jgi:Kunitz/Bovine pancreatic trypsin inhibitor domain
MTQLASISRSLCYAVCAVALASACGGESFTGKGGEAGSGATSQGGTTSTAGKTSTGGKAHGGSTSAGGSTSTGGMASAGSASAGSAGMFNEACDAPPGNGCDADFPRWHHDPATGICRPFSYGGCGATKNNYETLAACQKACPGGNPNYDACKVPTDCIVTGAGCCGVCDGPNLSAHDLIAYNKQYGIGVACGGGGPVPGAAGDAAPGVGAPIACPSCAAPAPGTGSLKNFVPDCVQGQCVVEDLRDSAVSACKVNADCRLRNGTSCCEACTSNDLVAVRSDGSFEKLVCGDVLPPCLACVPGKPANAVATCSPAGHCIVNYLLGGTDNAP